jgi:hypothetical protein
VQVTRPGPARHGDGDRAPLAAKPLRRDSDGRLTGPDSRCIGHRTATGTYSLTQSGFCESVVRQRAAVRTGRDTVAISDPGVDRTLRRTSAFFMVSSSFDLDIDDVICRPAARQEP